MNGCAYMEKAVLPSLVPLFHLWLERPEKTMVHGHCNDMESTYNKSLLLQHKGEGRVRYAALETAGTFSLAKIV